MKIATNYLISLFRGFGKEQGLECFGYKSFKVLEWQI